MAYTALYRQWRPQNFETLVGQQAVKRTLTNALSTGRIAHAYLFTGPRGTGKTSTARILAKALNCEHGPSANPCGHCFNCERITLGTSMDVFEIDAASNRGIEEIKALREQLAFAPVDGRFKIYIIDEVHMLTTEAFNALLKTLEEPPKHVVFILATTDPHKIPATIHSRCQRFDFHRVTVEEIAQHLAVVAEKSGIAADEEALRLIAIQSEGGMRDALSLLDQCGVMGQRVDVNAVREVLGIVGREALRSLVKSIGEHDISSSLLKLNAVLEQGKDVRQILVELADYLRAILLYKAAPNYNEIYLVDTDVVLSELAGLFGQERLLAAEERIHAAMQELKGTMRPKITAELCLLDLCRQEGSTIAALTARIESLEKKLAQVGTVSYNAPVINSVETAVDDTGVGGVTSAKIAIPSKTSQKVEAKEVKKPRIDVTEVKQEVVTSAAPEAYKAQSPDYIPKDASGDVPAGEEYWRKALEILKNEKKNAMVSCAKAGRVVAYNNGTLEVAFKSSFQCDRMNKDDYRKAFEDVLLRIARLAIHLQCVVEGKTGIQENSARGVVKPVVLPNVIKKSEAEASPLAPENIPQELQKAADIFGGTIKKI